VIIQCLLLTDECIAVGKKKSPVIRLLFNRSINEETAVKCMREGANDYIIKQFRTRLPLSIRSAIDQSKLLNEKQIAEEELKKSEEKYRALSENALDIVYRFNISPYAKFEYVSPSLQKITGIHPNELYSDYNKGLFLLNLGSYDFSNKENIIKEYKSGYIYSFVKDNGETVYIETKNEIFVENEIPISIQGIARDVTQRIIFQQQLKKSEESYRVLFDNNPTQCLYMSKQ
jgi:PAS domain S-box-containing protein